MYKEVFIFNVIILFSMKPNLETKIAGIKLKNPTILAAGVLGNTAESLNRVASSGAGAVTTKSITLNPKKGHSNPTVLELEKGFVNAMGLPNPGADKFVQELEKVKGVPVIVSVVGSSIEEYVKVAEKLSKYADMLELNVSCPNVKTGMIFGSEPGSCSELVRKIKKVSKIPVSVKLTPNTTNLIEVAKAVEKAGADCITAINTVGPGMVIDIETGKTILSNKYGGISGEMVKPIAVRCVYEIAQNTKLPIIGTGGISTGKDAAEMLMAGASAVGIGTAVKNSGIKVFRKICSELEQFMLRKKYKSIKELVGLALKS